MRRGKISHPTKFRLRLSVASHRFHRSCDARPTSPRRPSEMSHLIVFVLRTGDTVFCNRRSIEPRLIFRPVCLAGLTGQRGGCRAAGRVSSSGILPTSHRLAAALLDVAERCPKHAVLAAPRALSMADVSRLCRYTARILAGHSQMAAICDKNVSFMDLCGVYSLVWGSMSRFWLQVGDI